MFGDQLKKYRKELGLTQEAVAHRLSSAYSIECSAVNVGSWEKGTNPKIEVIIALADLLGVPEQFLFDDSDSKINRIVKKVIPSYTSFNEHTKKISLVDGYVGAGSSSYIGDEINVIDHLYVDKFMLDRQYRNRQLDALIVIGDSMIPYVDNSDIVIFSKINRGEYNLTDGKYIITTINGTMIKNLTFKTNGDIVISSCNKAYDKEIINYQETQESLDIIGVVVGRILKN